MVHEGVDGAAVKLLDLEKVKLIYTNPGYSYHFCLKWAFKDKSGGITRVVYFSSTLNKSIDDVLKNLCLMYIKFDLVLMKIIN